LSRRPCAHSIPTQRRRGRWRPARCGESWQFPFRDANPVDLASSLRGKRGERTRRGVKRNSPRNRIKKTVVQHPFARRSRLVLSSRRSMRAARPGAPRARPKRRRGLASQARAGRRGGTRPPGRRYGTVQRHPVLRVKATLTFTSGRSRFRGSSGGDPPSGTSATLERGGARGRSLLLGVERGVAAHGHVLPIAARSRSRSQ
jgi:hypothetical protein